MWEIGRKQHQMNKLKLIPSNNITGKIISKISKENEFENNNNKNIFDSNWS